MKKFWTLFKKELKEILTVQLLLPMIAVTVIFVLVGGIAGKEMAKNESKSRILILDEDLSEKSKGAIIALKKSGFFPEDFVSLPQSEIASGENFMAASFEKYGANALGILVFPKGFGEKISKGEKSEFEFHSFIKSFSLMQMKNSAKISAVSSVINDYLSEEILKSRNVGLNSEFIKSPSSVKEFVQVKNKKEAVSLGLISGFVSSQTTLIPIVLFLVITIAAQLIAAAIASEKENKTLETILSAPVGRKAIVAAKLAGAGVAALVSSSFYLLGMYYYMNGISGQTGMGAGSAKQAAANLGLVFQSADYLLLGASLFLGILAALAIAVILGALASDTKSAQGATTPLMILILLPYFLVFFVGLASASPILKWLVWLIPFSHPFLAAQNIMLGNYFAVFAGLIYLAFVFGFFVWLAAKIFSSDKILTLKVKFGKRSNFIG